MAVIDAQTIDLFDSWAPTYDQSIISADWGFEGYFDGMEWISQVVVRASPCDTVIDLGCGTGTLLAKLHNLRPSIEIIGVDSSARMLRLARRKVPSAKLIHADMRNLGVWELYLNSGRQCVVVSTYAFHHLTDADKIAILLQAFRKCQNLGLLFLLVDYAFLSATHRRRLLDEERMHGNCHIVDEIDKEHYADLSSIRRAITAAHLSLHVERNNIWDWRIALRRQLPSRNSTSITFLTRV